MRSTIGDIRVRRSIQSIVLVFILLVTFLGSSVPAASAMVPEGTLPPDTPVSNTDGIMALPEAAAGRAQNGAQGSGKLTPVAETYVDPAEANLPPVESMHTESVIGTDGRTRVTTTTAYPYRAIAYLVVTWAGHGSGTCTGWFYGPRTVGTAGHCVYDPSWGWATSIKVYPGRNGVNAPYGYTTSYRLFSVTGWVTSHSPQYDYGTIQTSGPKGNTVGWFGFSWQASNTFSGTFTISGYPGDKAAGTQWKMVGPFAHVTTYRLWYQMDTYGGQSGSPVFKTGCGTYCSVGYHTYGVGLTPNTNDNSTTRITQAAYNNMVAWKNRAYP